MSPELNARFGTDPLSENLQFSPKCLVLFFEWAFSFIMVHVVKGVNGTFCAILSIKWKIALNILINLKVAKVTLLVWHL
jgi:hypothetical protein